MDDSPEEARSPDGQLFSKRPGVALPAYRYRFRQALRRFVARPSPQKIPRGPLVLLADGLWFEFDGTPSCT